MPLYPPDFLSLEITPEGVYALQKGGTVLVELINAAFELPRQHGFGFVLIDDGDEITLQLAEQLSSQGFLLAGFLEGDYSVRVVAIDR